MCVMVQWGGLVVAGRTHPCPSREGNLTLIDDFYGFFVLVDSYEGEAAVYGEFAAFGVHLLDVDLDGYLEAGVAYVGYAGHQLHKCTGGDGLFEVDFVAAYGNHHLPAEAGCGYEGYFVHHAHGFAAKQGIVMVGGIGENGFKNAGFGGVYSFF